MTTASLRLQSVLPPPPWPALMCQLMVAIVLFSGTHPVMPPSIASTHFLFLELLMVELLALIVTCRAWLGSRNTSSCFPSFQRTFVALSLILACVAGVTCGALLAGISNEVSNAGAGEVALLGALLLISAFLPCRCLQPCVGGRPAWRKLPQSGCEPETPASQQPVTDQGAGAIEHKIQRCNGRPRRPVVHLPHECEAFRGTIVFFSPNREIGYLKEENDFFERDLYFKVSALSEDLQLLGKGMEGQRVQFCVRYRDDGKPQVRAAVPLRGC